MQVFKRNFQKNTGKFHEITAITEFTKKQYKSLFPPLGLTIIIVHRVCPLKTIPRRIPKNADGTKTTFFGQETLPSNNYYFDPFLKFRPMCNYALAGPLCHL